MLLSMVEGQRFTFKKEERVTGKKRIENLFAHGQSLPIRSGLFFTNTNVLRRSRFPF